MWRGSAIGGKIAAKKKAGCSPRRAARCDIYSPLDQVVHDGRCEVDLLEAQVAEGMRMHRHFLREQRIEKASCEIADRSLLRSRDLDLYLLAPRPENLAIAEQHDRQIDRLLVLSELVVDRVQDYV